MVDSADISDNSNRIIEMSTCYQQQQPSRWWARTNNLHNLVFTEHNILSVCVCMRACVSACVHACIWVRITPLDRQVGKRAYTCPALAKVKDLFGGHHSKLRCEYIWVGTAVVKGDQVRDQVISPEGHADWQRQSIQLISDGCYRLFG